MLLMLLLMMLPDCVLSLWPFDLYVVFSSPDLKPQMSFSDKNVSVVRRYRRRCRKLFIHIFVFFSRTTEPISIKLGTKHPWVKGIQVSSNEGPCPFLRVDHYEIAKKIVFSSLYQCYYIIICVY